MKQIQKEDLSNLKFDGIIVGVPIMEKIKEGQHDDISFIVECNYYSNGKHGYPEPGHGADNSSFYHVCYNTDVLQKGLWMNATSRFTIDHIFRFGSYKYYKFNDMTEFCVWYLETNKYFEKSDYGKWKEQKEWIQEKCNTNTPPNSVPKRSIGNHRMEKIDPDVKPAEPLIWDGEKYLGLKIKRKHRLKEVQQYVQKVMNIQDCKNSYEKTLDPRFKEKLEEQQKDLLNWLEEEI